MVFDIKNYNKEKLTFDLVKLNLYGILAFIPIIILYVVPYYLIWNQEVSIHALKKVVAESELLENTFSYSFSLLFIMILGVIVHELIHGITFSFFTKSGFKAIKFGIAWKMLTPYCHCKEPLLVKHYIIGGIMPAIILGFLPFIYSLLSGNLLWLAFAIFFTVAAIGDFYIIFILRKEDKNSMVLDHPSEVGCFIYREK
jgi:Putative zincin peptidase